MFVLINISLSFLVLLFSSWNINATTTALDAYVWKHDDNYHWVEMPQYGMKYDI